MLGTLGDLAARAGGRVAGDASLPIARLAAIDEAGPDALTFATTPAYFEAALGSRAGAVIASASLTDPARTYPKSLIVVEDARIALATLLRAFDRPRKTGPFVHPSAVVDPSAQLGGEVYIGAHAVVEAGAQVGDACVIDAGAYVGLRARIGSGTVLYPHARVLDDCSTGARCMLHPGATIGSEGFGYVFVGGRFERIPQAGNVVLGDDVEVGANTCIDRAQTGSTRIGDGVKIDNLCQIGHNCRIGDHAAMAAQVGLAGSTTLGAYVQVGGQSGFRGHLTVGDRARIAAGSAVWGDVAADAFISGRPARPHREELRREVMVRGLPKLVARVDALEQRSKP